MGGSLLLMINASLEPRETPLIQIKVLYIDRQHINKIVTPDSQSQQLKWQTAGDVITVNNPTPYYSMNLPV